MRGTSVPAPMVLLLLPPTPWLQIWVIPLFLPPPTPSSLWSLPLSRVPGKMLLLMFFLNNLHWQEQLGAKVSPLRIVLHGLRFRHHDLMSCAEIWILCASGLLPFGVKVPAPAPGAALNSLTAWHTSSGEEAGEHGRRLRQVAGAQDAQDSVLPSPTRPCTAQMAVIFKLVSFDGLDPGDLSEVASSSARCPCLLQENHHSTSIPNTLHPAYMHCRCMTESCPPSDCIRCSKQGN